MRKALATLWRWYLVPGVILGGIRLTSALLWSAFWPIDALFGISDDLPPFIPSLVILALAVVNAALTVFAWPLAVYALAVGKTDIWTTLFYPLAG